MHATALATVLLVPLLLLAALACGGATTSGTSASSAGTTPASANPSSSARQTAPANGTAPAPPASAVATFAGPLSGTDALVYLLAEGTTVNGYVCDGNEGKGDLSEWFATASSNGTFTTTSKNGVKVTGSVAGDQVVGTVTLADGSAHAFTIPAVTSPAGLYRGRTKDAAGHDILGGWIVLPDGTQRGYIEQDNIRTVAKALTPKQIQDGTSNISDGTSNISDGTSNTLIPVSRVSAAFRAP